MAGDKSVLKLGAAHLVSWSIAAGLIGLGVYLSKIHFMNSEWLSRAGCLIAMLGIWSGLGGIMQERLLGSRMRWRRRNALIKARARLEDKGATAEEIDKELTEIDETFESKHADLTHELKLSVGSMEVALLLTGTFLWGFGDLLVR